MSRHDAALAGLAALAGAVAIAFTWQPGLASLYDDSVFYLMMAQAMAPYGSASPAVLAAAPFDTYPPFLPLVVALAGGAFDWRVAHAVVAASFAASVFLLGLHARAISASAAMGFAAALVYAFMPGVWLNVKGILSEFPYMALSFAALVAYGRMRAAPLTWPRVAGMGVLLAALVLTRNIGVALLAMRGVLHVRRRCSRCRWRSRRCGCCCALRAARMPTPSSGRAWRAAPPTRGSPGRWRWRVPTPRPWSTRGSTRS